MKSLILVFSPSGHTLSVAETIKKKFEESIVDISLVNITHNADLLNATDDKVCEIIKGYDLLIIGAPVYAGHFESNMLRFISHFPHISGKCAVFVTYGGAHSSLGLSDAASAVKAKGLTVVAGLKIASTHILAQNIESVLNNNKPGKEEFSLVKEFSAELINHLSTMNADVSSQFEYAPEQERLLFQQKSQDDWHKTFRTVTINTDICIKCGKCVSGCPVNRIKESKGTIVYNPEVTCILCGECYFNCPAKAVRFDYASVVAPRLGSAKLETPASQMFV